jgi:hypothetical protein
MKINIDVAPKAFFSPAEAYVALDRVNAALRPNGWIAPLRESHPMADGMLLWLKTAPRLQDQYRVVDLRKVGNQADNRFRPVEPRLMMGEW